MGLANQIDPATSRDSRDGPPDGAMGFLDHLDYLRTRLIRSCIAVGVGMAIASFFVDWIAAFVLAPTVRIMPPGTQLQMTRPGEGFAFDLDIAHAFSGTGFSTPSSSSSSPPPSRRHRQIPGRRRLAAPMLVMYMVSIAVAWLATPRREKTTSSSHNLRLVVAATVIDHARRNARASGWNRHD